MAVYTNHNDLLAPYLKLDQGGKVQAECMFRFTSELIFVAPDHLLLYFSRRLD
jgi:hypothetical protein